MWGIILILVGIRPKNMSPVCRALSLFGLALWLMPHVSPGWGFTVTGALPLVISLPIWFTKILSISVAEFLLTLVGLSVVGIKE